MVRGMGLGRTGNSKQMHSHLCQRRQPEAHDFQVFTESLEEKINSQGVQTVF